MIPKDWNPEKLSGGQKSWITKLTQKAHTRKDGTIAPEGKLHRLILRPDQFSVVKADTKAKKGKLGGAGMPVFNNRGVIHTEGGHARWEREKLVIEKPSGQRTDMWFASSKNFNAELRRAHAHKLAPNEVWSFSVGDNNANVSYRNLGDMLHYLQAKRNWHDSDPKHNVHPYISLNLVSENRPHVIKHHPSNKKRAKKTAKKTAKRKPHA